MGNFNCFLFLNPFTFDSAKSKIGKFCKTTYWVKLTNKQHHSKVLLNSFPVKSQSHFRVLSIEPKALGVEGLRALHVI